MTHGRRTRCRQSLRWPTTGARISAGRRRDGKSATHHAEPAGAQEPADLRVLCRAARPVPRAASTPTTCKAVVVTGAGGNFCSGGDVHEIIGPLTKMTMPELLDVHAHDRRPGEGDARTARSRSSPRSTASAPAPARCSRWPPTCASARRARKTAFLFIRVGLAGCDMGACALLPRIDRPGPRGRAALHRPRDERRRRPRAGASSTASSSRDALRDEAHGAGARARRRADVRARMTKKHAAPGMGDGPRRRRSRPKRRRRRSACRPRTSAAPTRRSRRSRSRCSKATDWRSCVDRAHLDWPFFDAAHRDARARARRVGAAAARARTPRRDDVDAALPRAGARARRRAAGCATACRRRHGGALPAIDSRALCLVARDARAITTASPTSRSRCRASAAARSRSPARAAQKRALAAARRARRRDRRLRAVRARRRLRRRAR